MKLEIIKTSGSQLSVDIGTMWATCYHRERYAVLYNVQEPHQLLTMRGNNCISSLRLYSQTCIKRSPLGQSKKGLIRQVTS
jgi:hypothetical protein